MGIARANLVVLAISVAAMPLMSRLFTPSDYGALATFTAIYGVGVALCTWRFDWSVPNARSDTMAVSLLVVGVAVLAGVCMVTTAAAFVVNGTPKLHQTTVGSLGALLFLLPVALAGGGMRIMLSAWCVREGDLTPMSRAMIFQSASNSALGIAAGLAKLGAPGLVGTSAIAPWLGIWTLVRGVRTGLSASSRRVTPRTLRTAVRAHAAGATWSTAVSAVSALSFSAPVLLLTQFYSLHQVGWYALMQRVLAAPISAMTSALNQSFWSQAAEYGRARRMDELRRLYRRTTLKLGLACVPVVAVCVAGPLVIGPIFGRQWDGAGEVLLAMLPLFIGIIVFSPTNHLVVFNRQALQIIADALRLVLVVVSFALARVFDLHFVTLVLLISLSSLLGYVCLYYMHTRAHHERG